MICFYKEIWINTKVGMITGGITNRNSTVVLYKVLGNKRVRVGRIIEWERKNISVYPRLKYYMVTQLTTLDRREWRKTSRDDHLIPYKCT